MSDQKTFTFSIVTTEQTVYEKEVYSATIPTGDGEITVLPHHIPLVSTVTTGSIRVHSPEGEYMFAVAGGVLEIRRSNKVIILASRTEPVEAIDVARAEAAYRRAKQYLEEKRDMSDVEYARFQAILEKNLNRIKVARNRK